MRWTRFSRAITRLNWFNAIKSWWKLFQNDYLTNSITKKNQPPNCFRIILISFHFRNYINRNQLKWPEKQHQKFQHVQWSIHILSQRSSLNFLWNSMSKTTGSGDIILLLLVFASQSSTKSIDWVSFIKKFMNWLWIR